MTEANQRGFYRHYASVMIDPDRKPSAQDK
jgi:hypothetical protein